MDDNLMDIEFRNWLKACMSLKCIQEGMVPFMEHHFNEHYSINNSEVVKSCLLEKYSCNQCDINDLEPFHKDTKTCGYKKCNCKKKNQKPCPANHSCGVIHDQIQMKHWFNDPNWSNTESKLWSSVPWEQMKCYIQTPGYRNKTNIHDGDLTAMVQICLNYKPLRTVFGLNLPDLEEVLKIRNKIYHSSKLRVSDVELQRVFSHLKTFLKLGIFKDFQSNITVQLDTIEKLESDTFSITKQIELNTVNDALEGIQKSVDEMLENQMKLSQETDRLLRQEDKLREMYKEMLSKTHTRINETAMEQHKANKKIINKLEAQQKTISDIREMQSTHNVVLNHVQKKTLESHGLMLAVYDKLMLFLDSKKAISKKTVEDDNDSASASFTLETKCTINMEDTDASEQFSKELHNSAHGILTLATINEEDNALNNALADGLNVLQNDGNKITDVKLKCVEIYIESASLQSWMALCEKFFNGVVMTSFQPLQSYFRTFRGSQNMTLNIILDETYFAKCVNTIIQNIEDVMKQHNNVEPKAAQLFERTQDVADPLDVDKILVTSTKQVESIEENITQENESEPDTAQLFESKQDIAEPFCTDKGTATSTKQVETIEENITQGNESESDTAQLFERKQDVAEPLVTDKRTATSTKQAQLFERKQDVAEPLGTDKRTATSTKQSDIFNKFQEWFRQNTRDSGFGSVVSDISLEDGASHVTHYLPFHDPAPAPNELYEEHAHQKSSHKSGFAPVFDDKPPVEVSVTNDILIEDGSFQASRLNIEMDFFPTGNRAPMETYEDLADQKPSPESAIEDLFAEKPTVKKSSVCTVL